MTVGATLLAAIGCALAAAGCGASGGARTADATSEKPRSAASSEPARAAPSELCRSVAADVQALGKRYPQLAQFDAARAIEKPDCRIAYEYHCQSPSIPDGWSTAVPNPDPDGLWLYIGIWDEDDPIESTDRINAQPASPGWKLGSRRVTYLILEGTQTKPVSSQILAILAQHGMR